MVKTMNPDNFDCLLDAITYTIEAENETYPELYIVSIIWQRFLANHSRIQVLFVCEEWYGLT